MDKLPASCTCTSGRRKKWRKREPRKARRSCLKERGVNSETAKLLPEDSDAAIPIQIQRQLQEHFAKQEARQEQERNDARMQLGCLKVPFFYFIYLDVHYIYITYNTN